MTSQSSPASPHESPDHAADRSDTALDREIATEQAHVDLVYARLAEATRSARHVASEGRSLFQRDRADFVREEDGTGLYERDVFAFQSAKRLAVLDEEHEGLVFGRLDHTTGEIRYVGRIGVRDEDYEPLVIDWRARAAEPFYRATPTDPMDIVRRRVLRSRGNRVVGIEDDLLDGENASGELVIIGEGALMAALSRARGHTMKDIVATIQAEQDEAIRAPYQGVTTISGGPGTGKTVVALHRAAYLLYSHRRRFENGGVLVIGPSAVFMNYIERVLPSLGEDTVTLRPIGTVASDVIKLRGERIDTPAAAAVKGSLRMAPILRKLVFEPLVSTPESLNLTVKGEALVLRAETLHRIRREVLSHHKLNQGREAAEAALLNALWRVKPAEVDLEREEFDDVISDIAAYRMFTHAWWPPLSAGQALARLSDPEVVGRLAGSTLSTAEQEALSSSYRDGDEWSVADGALLDELVDQLGPVPEPESGEISLFIEEDEVVNEVVTTMDRLAGPREIDPFAEAYETYAHILVDEAQDITPMQWRMLRRRGAQASWTIVGDPAQSSWPDSDEAAKALADMIGSAPQRHFRMSTNYRSPAEVFDLAAAVVVEAYPEADLPKAVRTTGFEPELRIAEDGLLADGALEAVRTLLEQVEGTVGVICPPSLVAEVAAAVAESGWDPATSSRIVTVTPLQSKGLEYDGVVVVSPDDIVAESPGGVRVLYVALTRPTQRLITLDAGPGAIWRKSLG